jgi:RNA-binding protein
MRFLREVYFPMDELTLTGAQKSFLRGLGQQLEPTLKVGKGGLTPAFFFELQRHLRASELVKLRFLGSDRDEQAAFCVVIAETSRCACVGAVGHTALFYLPNPTAGRISLPE